MANSAPIIGETGLDFAVDIVNAGYRTGHNAKLCLIGDSISVISPDGVFGHWLRLANPPAQLGHVASGSSQPGFNCSSTNQTYYTVGGPSPGDTGGIIDPALYAVDGAFEYAFNATAIGAPSVQDDNKLYSGSAKNTDPTRSLFECSFEDQYWHGDWISDHMDGAGDIVFTVWFYANADGVATNRLFLRASYANTNLVDGSAFNVYDADGAITSQSLTIPAEHAAYAPSITVKVQVTEGAALDGKNVIILSSEVKKANATGLTTMWISRGAYGTTSTGDGFANTAKYSVAAWDHLAQVGVTHVMIALCSNAAVDHTTELQSIISRIKTYSPNCKFCLLAPYDLDDSGVDGRIDEAYAVARAGGHLFLNLSKLFPAKAISYADISATWANDQYYYAGDVVKVSTTYYQCSTAHTSSASPATITDDAANWTSLGVLAGGAVNHILQNTAGTRNFVMSDGTHPNRARGTALYAAGMWALLREAAEAAQIQLGNNAVFYK